MQKEPPVTKPRIWIPYNITLNPMLAEYDIESNFQIFEKSKNTIDVYNYGSKYAEGGLDPMKTVLLANFTYNITQLLEETLVNKERLQKDVILHYLGYNTKEINRFNSFINFELMGAKEIMLRFSDIRIERGIDYAYKNRRYRLKHNLQTLYDKRQHLDISTKYEMDLKQKREEKLRLYAAMMEQQKLSIPDVHHHVDRPFFDELFNGIRNFFVRMFGS